MKYYAVQVAPEMQEATTLMDWIDSELELKTLSLYGNHEFTSHMFPEFEQVAREVHEGNMEDTLYECAQTGETLTDVEKVQLVEDYFTPIGRKHFTLDECNEIISIVRHNWEDTDTDDQHDICKLMTIVSGHLWECRCIHGCVQGDWQYMYYQKNLWTRMARENFEVEYFNTGIQWDVYEYDNDEKFILEEAENNCTDFYCVYTHCIMPIKDEIADEFNCSIDDVTLYNFTGWRKVPNYCVD